MYQKFCEYRDNNSPVTTRNLREWALHRSVRHESEDYSFCASTSWANRFKKEFRISQRKVTRYIKPSQQRSLENLQITCESFQAECRSDIANYSLDYVLNTDQMGVEYRANVNRTLAHTGQKAINVYLGDMNKVTHSYTAQYTITASGKLLPKVFLCLQESTGTFGPRVQHQVDLLCQQYKNVYVISSKSGKLSSALFDTYLSDVLMAYVGENRFLLLLDSWGGQANGDLYTKFKSEAGQSTCLRKVIPEGCTPYIQPLDVYLHRQIKIFIKEFQNCSYLLQEERQINSREDAIKLHSIVLHQLSSPIFNRMIEYSWFASKLITDRDVFANVREVCFPQISRKKSKCSAASCQNIIFIKCAWCRNKFCFHCFYDNYHPGSCDQYYTNV